MKIRKWLERWNGFPEPLTPLLVAVLFIVTITRNQGYVEMALLVFVLIYLELRQIRKRLGHGPGLPDDKE